MREVGWGCLYGPDKNMSVAVVDLDQGLGLFTSSNFPLPLSLTWKAKDVSRPVVESLM